MLSLPIIASLAQAKLLLEKGEHYRSKLATKLTEICRKRPKSGLRFGFYHEIYSNRGWFANNHEDVFILLEFEARSTNVVVVDKSLCSLEVIRDASHRQYYTLHVKAPNVGNAATKIENLSEKVYLWLIKWVT